MIEKDFKGPDGTQGFVNRKRLLFRWPLFSFAGTLQEDAGAISLGRSF